MAHNDNNKTAILNTKDTQNNKSDEELIDLDKELPFKLDSDWLLECTGGRSTEFQDSFSKLNFSSPIINEMVKSVYQTGKSKQVLHQLLYWNEKMTISCDNCAYLYRNSVKTRCHSNNNNNFKRHSLAVTSMMEKSINSDNNSSNNSLTDSLDSLTVADREVKASDSNGNVPSDRMTQSSITDYTIVPTESITLPLVNNNRAVSTSQSNVLSRTYDKEDLEILKQTELSKSVFVPHIKGSKIDHYSEINQSNITTTTNVVAKRHSFATSVTIGPQSNYLKRLFPIATSMTTTTTTNRPKSSYQIDKLTKSTIDRCMKMSAIKIQPNNLSNFNTKKLMRMNEQIFESDVRTPTINNLQKNVKHFLTATTNQQSRLKRPNIARK